MHMFLRLIYYDTEYPQVSGKRKIMGSPFNTEVMEDQSNIAAGGAWPKKLWLKVMVQDNLIHFSFNTANSKCRILYSKKNVDCKLLCLAKLLNAII